MKRKHKSRKKKATLADLVKAAHEAGARVTCGLEQRTMPLRLPNDPKEVALLIDESERCSKLGNQWLHAETPNQIAAEACLRNGWAHSLSAAWLRCKLKGELQPESGEK